MADNPEDWKIKRRDYSVAAVFCFLIGSFFFMKVITGSYIIKSSDLSAYDNLITSEAPKFKETKGKHSRKWIEFKCVDNKSTFEIASYDYSCVNDDEVLNEIKAGDTISIAILKEDIGDFDDETYCEIHSLIKNDKEYLDLQCRNEVDNEGGVMWYISLFAISIMTAIVYSFSQKPKLFDKVNPVLIIAIIVFILLIVLRSY